MPLLRERTHYSDSTNTTQTAQTLLVYCVENHDDDICTWISCINPRITPMNLMQEELDTAMAEYDTDGSGQLEFDEFVAMV